MDSGPWARLDFNGTGVDWIAYRDPWSGIANAYLDGALAGSVDLYADPAQSQAVVYSTSGLAPGPHTLRIESTGTHSPASAGSWVSIDAFAVACAGGGSGGSGSGGSGSGGSGSGGSGGSAGGAGISGISCGLADSAVHIPGALAIPARGDSYRDPVFGCTVRRLTDAAAEGAPAGEITHPYSTVSPFNSDASYLITEYIDGRLQIRDLQGTIIKPDLSRFGILPLSNPVWSRSDRNLIYFHPDGGNRIQRYNVATDEVTVLYTFPHTSITFGAGKGDLGWDGDHIAIIADDRFGLIYSISANSTTSAADLSPYLLQPNHDNAEMTPNGLYLLETASPSGGGVTYRFDSAMGFLGIVASFQGHGDTTRDRDGSDVLVQTNSNAAPGTTLANCPNGQVKVRVADGAQTCLQTLDWTLATHTSCNNVGQGFCAVSTYSGDTPTGTWPAFADEIFLVQLDGSPTLRIAHSRSRDTAFNYDHMPRAAVSPDGRYVVFDSDMAGAVDVYLLLLQ
jgi:hypothetical protein